MAGLTSKLGLIKKHELICLFLLLLVIYNMNLRPIGSTDTIPASLLPFSILNDHNLYLDKYSAYYTNPDTWPGSYSFMVQSGGHWLSGYPIVTPVLITPLYIIPDAILYVTHSPEDMASPVFKAIRSLMEKLIGSAITALSGVFIYLSLKEVFSKKTAIIGALIYALATDSWAISSQGLWQHGTVQLLLSMMIFLVLINEKKHDDKNLVYLGTLSGLFFFNRPSDSLLLLPILWYVFSSAGKKSLYYLAAMAVVSLPFAAYNLHYFGNPFGGYSSLMSSFSLGLFTPVRFLGLLVSPSRGLFIFTPVILLAIPGFLMIRRLDSNRIRNFFYVSGASALLLIATYSLYDCWWGGGCYGPRLLTGLLPFAAVYIAAFLNGYVNAPALDNIGKAIIILVAILIFASIIVQVIGTFYFPTGQWTHENGNGPTGENIFWDWASWEIRAYVDGGLYNPFSNFKNM
jgi:hypothetical protein